MESVFNDNKYEIALYDTKLSRDGFSEDGAITTGCTVFVYTAGTKNLATIYSTGTRTALANPISRATFAAEGKIEFFGPDASYDITVNDSLGNTLVQPGVTPRVHSLAIDRSGIEKCLIFPMVFNAGGTVVDTGLDLPGEVLVHDVRVEVVTADATETVDVGLLASETAGDEDGFITALSVAATGYPATRPITVGTNENFLSAVRVGALMGSLRVGVDTAGREGQTMVAGHIVTGSNARSITYTPSSSDTFAGYGYVYFRHIR